MNAAKALQSRVKGKRSKASVGFEEPAKGPHHCSQCVHFLPAQNACRLVAGMVDGDDWCKLWRAK